MKAMRLCLAVGMLLALGACNDGDGAGPEASLSPASTSVQPASPQPAGPDGQTSPAPVPLIPTIDPSRIVISPGGLPAPPNVPVPPVPVPVPPNLPNFPR